MVVSEVVGVGIFLTPATMMRSLGSAWAALGVWAVVGALTAAGALCYAELTTRFPKAGGGYVFLREAYGPRTAFLYGWMVLLVMDPGITAALSIGFGQYMIAASGLPDSAQTPTALAAVIAFGAMTLAGFHVSAGLMRWTAIAKLAIVVLLVGAGLLRSGGPAADALGATGRSNLSAATLAPSLIAAFFAFGGWWELGRMSEEVESPRRTMPRALIGGVALVTGIYVLVTLSFVVVASGQVATGDEAFVALIGTALFGEYGGPLLAGMVVIAVAGSLAAVLLGGPRVYVAMARDGVFSRRLVRFDERRHTAPVATIIQVTLACILVVLGTFDQILAYFVPVTILFLGLSAAAVLVLPRPADDGVVFRAPLHPLPILLFLTLIVAMLTLFVMGQPWQTMFGALVVMAGIPVSWLVIRRAR